MKSICVTGACPADLNFVGGILAQAGMAAPNPAHRSPPVDMTLWHEKVLFANDASVRNSGAIQPGALWTQLAGDIFLANMDCGLWGWADARSALLLDFWLQFDPNLYFVLVYSSREQILTYLVSDATSTQSVAETLETWQLINEAILRFHHRHPDRSVLIDSTDCAAAPMAFIDAIRSRFELPLTILTEPAISPIETEPVAVYLAKQLSLEFPQNLQLQHELDATKIAFQSVLVEKTVPTPEQIIESYGRLRSSAIASATIAGLLAQQDAMQAEINLMAYRSDQQAEIAGQQIHQLEAAHLVDEGKIQALRNELDKLASAYQAQIELTEQRQARIDEISRIHAENSELLLSELHKAHLENEWRTSKHETALIQLQVAQARWQRVQARYPAIFDAESLEITCDPDDAEGTAQLRMKNATIAGRHFDQFAIKTALFDDVVAVALPPQAQGNLLLRWPLDISEETEIWLVPGAEEDLTAEVLLSLSTSDWKMMQALPEVLGNIVENIDDHSQPTDLGHSAYSAGLANFSAYLESLPQRLRYDNVELVRAQVNPDYEHLWLRLNNVLFAGRHWGAFEFRLSSSNVSAKNFLSHPKLEFPDMKGRDQLENWFAESRDDFGNKLELRFALPNAMDIGIWEKLSDCDRALIMALVAQLPEWLAQVRKNSYHLARSWNDWLQLAAEIKRILQMQQVTYAR